jgi:hypothetical protein
MSQLVERKIKEFGSVGNCVDFFLDVPVSNLDWYTRFCADTFVGRVV